MDVSPLFRRRMRVMKIAIHRTETDAKKRKETILTTCTTNLTKIN